MSEFVILSLGIKYWQPNDSFTVLWKNSISANLTFSSWLWLIPFAVEALAGIIVLEGAIKLYRRPHEARQWSHLILIFATISFVLQLTGLIPMIGTTGLMMGAFGIIGGTLALNWKPLSKNL